MGIKNGSQYIQQIDHSKPEVWLSGQRVLGRISNHKAFRGLMLTQAALYDMQSELEYKDRMTYISPTTGNPVGLSYLQPTTKDDLVRRRVMMSLWGERHHGMMGRSPDYMNTALMAFQTAAELLTEASPEFANNLRNYYEYCRENDVTLSHVFVQPQSSRVVKMMDDGSFDTQAAKIVDKNQDGIVINGAFLLATQGVTSDEVWVHPPVTTYLQETNNPNTFVFAVPNNLPGMKWIARESMVGGDSSFDYPLSSRFEEMDTLIVFDHVLVPWNRVFVAGNDRLSQQLFSESAFHTHSAHQVICRYVTKSEFLLGVVLNMVETLDIGNHPHIIEKVSEIIVNVETLKSLLIASEVNASLDRWGSMLPDRNSLWTANVLFPKIYPRILEIIQLIGSSGLIMIPSESDFNTEIEPYLSTYLTGNNTDAKNKVQLFRLAWELSSSGFGGRQSLYERFFFGDSNTVNRRLFHGYSHKDKYMNRVNDFLK
ncbi:4-hydroxyphenylacetate 3-monooxygenase, oxygenase component [Paenibacillus macquariensis]|uniref:4-hydroxyphenylacetate 3-monooxygenase n=1 Tax=Paenibacillus macquariensis TaxID=948756 RepID=A0ABY1KC15_9BACL|nr:4-hydroxyphenylacetate 3-monooxygenase, oxygenase component [Paenibacillus macquariensis]MEC0089588.1 4-hydroxyphenylacetate 3-monooxygenase, oxygenase component [Paenibacillus macquariensis]OAB30920.1 4-hydroxyphenylacetate 3-monooxygenase, oxygenase component [Paenibacillus macquariensis subsp. macquariensis]SIR58113.1 4-hydroxyphenylacetate 3-monooxygenase [Paenibacillus macquariensis]